MNIYEGVGFCMIGSLLFFALREWKSGLAPLLPVVGGLAVLGASLKVLSESGVFSFFADYGVTGETAKLVSKVLSVGFLTEIGADVCEELGSGALAKRLVFFGNAEILLLVWPLLSEILGRAMELLS